MEPRINVVAGLERRPSWELQAMVRALSLHPWNNTAEEADRLEAAKIELAGRRIKGKGAR